MLDETGFSYSELEHLLDKQNVTADEILFHPDVIKECQAKNQKLLNFLTQSSTLKMLVHTIVSGPDLTVPYEDQYKKCDIASQLLATWNPQISAALLQDSDLLNALYTSLLNPSLSHLLAAFIYRIFKSLTDYDTDEVSGFFSTRSDISQLILTNLSRYAVWKLLCRILVNFHHTDLIDRLANSELVSDLLNRFTIDYSDETHTSVILLLAEMCNMAKTKSSIVSEDGTTVRWDNPLLLKLESMETLQTMLSHIFDSSTEADGSCTQLITSDSLLINGLVYFRVLIDNFAVPSLISFFAPVRLDAGLQLPPIPSFSPSNWRAIRPNISDALLPCLGALKYRLLKPCNTVEDERTSTLTPCGPFTTVRLYIVRFMAYLFDTQSDELLRELLRLDMLNVIMDLFFEYPLNSFLHSTCERLVRFLVLCALFQLETKPSHQVSVSLTSADAVHKAFFGTPQPSLEQSTISESTLADQSDTRSLNSPPTVFWMFLHRLLVAGNLLGRIPQIWMNSQSNL
ncbi:hypothetical protein PHET_09526 [Paragonimus heterotremus]|uniref:Uncharacterized protein n=1 Tax=Paragonimus heterotremus TaxID=100268 RepID=A0A8J4SH36_9TREM|nr:hypothetical protein PHET_09526 [Paragonimus heterotremus]